MQEFYYRYLFNPPTYYQINPTLARKTNYTVEGRREAVTST